MATAEEVNKTVRAVLDTSVLLSAERRPLLLFAANGLFTLVWIRDPDDHPIMATALAGQVDYLVTWNTRDFPPKQRFAGITILTPDAFLRLLTASTRH